MTFELIKNTSKHNRGMDINNNLINVPCQRKSHSCNDLNKNMFVITKSNCNASKNGYFFLQICKREKHLFEHTKLIETNFKIITYIFLIKTIYHIKKLPCFHFCILGAKLDSRHALFHFYGPFLDFFG